jgi:MFS family permease
LTSRFNGLWRHPDFVRLWAGETTSIFGSLIGGLALQFTAILWLGANPLEVSLLAAFRLVPGFVVGLAAGVWVDRLPRRPIMIVADAGRAAALATIPIAALLGALTMNQLYLVSFATSALTVFFDAAYRSYLPTLVSSEELVEGNSKLTASASLAEFGSFGVSGWLVQLVKGPGAIAIDALSFVVSALCVWRIKTPEPPPPPVHEREPALREALEGARVVARQPVLRTLAGVNAIEAFGNQMFSVVFLLYLVDEIGYKPGVLGMIFAIGGLTSLGGAYMAGRTSRLGGLGPALLLAAAVRCGGGLFTPFVVDVSLMGIALLVAAQIVTDPFWALYDINDVSLRQTVTPERLQGRVFANFQLLEFGAALLGTAAGGLLGEAIGLRETLFLRVAVSAVAVLWLVVSPVARLRKMPEPAAAGA